MLCDGFLFRMYSWRSPGIANRGIMLQRHFRLLSMSSVQGLLFWAVEVRNWWKVQKCGLITEWPYGSCCGPQSILINESLWWCGRLLHPQSRQIKNCLYSCPVPQYFWFQYFVGIILYSTVFLPYYNYYTIRPYNH